MAAKVLDGFVEKGQTAWIPGRKIQDSIKSFNEQFYKNLENEEQFFLLLIDFAKAFDSVSHDFIFLLLEKQGFPDWYVQVVRHLLLGVGAYTTLRGASRKFIDVLTGVKQGCPLSTVIFILIIDPLLFFLKSSSCYFEGTDFETHPQGFADDSGVGFHDVRALNTITRVYDDFCEAVGSKYRVNRTKSCLLSTLPLREEEKQVIGCSRWPDIPTPERAKYLGFLMGRGVTTEEVYQAPLGKFTQRVNSYMHLRSLLSTTSKIRVANYYLNSIFSYISPLLHMPNSVVSSIRAKLRDFIVPFGRGQSLESLMFEGDVGGLKSPLRDPYLACLAGLATHYNPEQPPPPPAPEWCEGRNLETPRITTHTYHGFHYALEYRGGLETERRASYYYKALNQSDYIRDRARDSIRQKLTRRGIPHATLNIPDLGNFSQGRKTNRKTNKKRNTRGGKARAGAPPPPRTQGPP